MTNPDVPAFPVPAETNIPGLTKLEYFAGLVMQGLVSNPAFNENGSLNLISETSVICAKALIDELNKKTNDQD